MSAPGSEILAGIVPVAELDDYRPPLGFRPGGLAYSVANPGAGRPVVVLGGISSDRFPWLREDGSEGWWARVVRPRGGVDPEFRTVIGFDYLGGRGASPPAQRPAGTPLRGISTRVQARALAAVLDRLDCVEEPVDLVGASYGGMVAMQLAAARPSLVRRLVVISAAHRTHPMATALRSLQRRVLDWGVEVGEPERGVALARGIGMTTYRTATEFDTRFGTTPSWECGVPRFEVESYLEHQGRRAVAHLPAEALRVLSESADTHVLSPELLRTPTTAVSVTTDTLVPVWLVGRFVERHGGECRHITLQSPFGHDAFLKEDHLVGEILLEAVGGDR